MPKALIFLADGFEEVEAVTVVDFLRRAGIEVKMVSISRELAVSGAHGIKIMSDALFEDIRISEADAVVLPGGLPGADNLAAHLGVCEAVKLFASSEGRICAAICAAPAVLGAGGLLEGKKYTCYPGFENDSWKGIYSRERVCKDGNIITSRGPATAADFALMLIEVLCGFEKAASIKDDVLY